MNHRIYNLHPELNHDVILRDNDDNPFLYIFCHEKPGDKEIKISDKVIIEANNERCKNCCKHVTKFELIKQLRKIYRDFLTLNKKFYLQLLEKVKSSEPYQLHRTSRYFITCYPALRYWVLGNLTNEQFEKYLDAEMMIKIWDRADIGYSDVMIEIFRQKEKDYYTASESCYGFANIEDWTKKQLSDWQNTGKCGQNYRNYPTKLTISHPCITWVYSCESRYHYAIESNYETPLHLPNVHPDGEICFGGVERPVHPVDLVNNYWQSNFNMDLTTKLDISHYIDEDGYADDEPHTDHIKASDWFRVMPNLAYTSDRTTLDSSVDIDVERYNYHFEVPFTVNKLLVITNSPESLRNWRTTSILMVEKENSTDYLCRFCDDLGDTEEFKLVKINKEMLKNG